MAKKKTRKKRVVVNGPPVSKRKGIHRKSVRNKMPKRCFLRPQDRGYPICPASSAKDGKYRVDCRLVRAAITRAAQHGHKDILAKARRLYKRHCSS